MYYARIKDNVVKGVIVLEDQSLIPLFSVGYDHFIHLGDELLPGMASVGFIYNPESNTFSRADEVPEEVKEE